MGLYLWFSNCSEFYSGKNSGPVLHYRCTLPLHITKTDPSKVCTLENESTLVELLNININILIFNTIRELL